jgi:hypothetical protein
VNPKHILPPTTRRAPLPTCDRPRVAPQGNTHTCLTCRNPVDWVNCAVCGGIGAKAGVICNPCAGRGGQWVHGNGPSRVPAPPQRAFGSEGVS